MTDDEWIGNYCKARGLDWSTLSCVERTRITMFVPCSIRCWRIGGAVDVAPDKPCPECGKINRVHIPTRYELIADGWLPEDL